MKAVVVFTDEGVHWLAPVLKEGFRHVGVAIQSDKYWVGIDPRMGTPAITVYAEAGFDIATYFRGLGHAVVETEVSDTETRWPFALANCVGVVKAILGVRDLFVWTPFQLYRHLMGTKP